jgi:hypothetical protein
MVWIKWSCPGFTRLNGEIAPAFVVQAAMWLPQHRDSTTEFSLTGWFWSSLGASCDPTLVFAALPKSISVEYEEAYHMWGIINNLHNWETCKSSWMPAKLWGITTMYAKGLTWSSTSTLYITANCCASCSMCTTNSISPSWDFLLSVPNFKLAQSA